MPYLYFAVNVEAQTPDITLIGLILMIAGAAWLHMPIETV